MPIALRSGASSIKHVLRSKRKEHSVCTQARNSPRGARVLQQMLGDDAVAGGLGVGRQAHWPKYTDYACVQISALPFYK